MSSWNINLDECKSVQKLSYNDSSSTNNPYNNARVIWRDTKGTADIFTTYSSFSAIGGFRISAGSGVTFTGNSITDGLALASGGIASSVKGFKVSDSNGRVIFQDSTDVLGQWNHVRKLTDYSSSWLSSQALQEHYYPDGKTGLVGLTTASVSSTTGTFTATPFISFATTTTNNGWVQRQNAFYQQAIWDSVNSQYVLPFELKLREVHPFFNNSTQLMTNIGLQIEIDFYVNQNSTYRFINCTQGAVTTTLNSTPITSSVDSEISALGNFVLYLDSYELNAEQWGLMRRELERGLTITTTFVDYEAKQYQGVPLNSATGGQNVINHNISTNSVLPQRVWILSSIANSQTQVNATGFMSTSTYLQPITPDVDIRIDGKSYLPEAPSNTREIYLQVEQCTLMKNQSTTIAPILNYSDWVNLYPGLYVIDTHFPNNILNPLTGKSVDANYYIQRNWGNATDISYIIEAENTVTYEINDSSYKITVGW